MSKQYKYEAIVDDLLSKIEKGRYEPGDALPSLRSLCQQYGVSLATANAVIMELEAQGVVEVRPRSGVYVTAGPDARLQEGSFAAPEKSKPALITQWVDLNDVTLNVATASMDEDIVPFGMIAPDPAYIPVKQINTYLSRVCRENNPRDAYYDFPPGHFDFRVEVAKQALQWGGDVDPNEIVTTSGALEAVNLGLRTTCKPGQVVAMESPTYYCYLQILQTQGLKALEVPTDPLTGIDIDILEDAMARKAIDAVVLIPNYNNPLGFLMPDSHKERLAKLAAQYQVPIIEDDVYGDLSYGPIRPKPLKAFDEAGWVVYCTSVSKSLIPGYRCGWAIPGRYLEVFKRLKWMSTAANASLQMPAMAHYFRDGHYERHLRKFRPVLSGLNKKMIAAMEHYFPEGTKITRPTGGYLIWVELPGGVDSLDLYQHALENKISISPGPMFSVSPDTYRSFMRMNYCFEWTDRIEHSIEILGQGTKKLMGQTTT